MTHRIVRDLLTVWFDLTGAATFDFTNMEVVALAQSYNLDTNVATNSLVANDLANPAGGAEWARPEPTEKTWTLSCDQLLLSPEAGGEYDATSKVTNEAAFPVLKAGTLVWVMVGDSDLASGDTIPLYGQAYLTTYSQAGTIDEWHTYSLTATGVGELLDQLVIAP